MIFSLLNILMINKIVLLETNLNYKGNSNYSSLKKKN